MRGRLVLILLFATTGCTRDNPAFDGSTGTAETSGDGDPTTLDSADTQEAGSSEEGSTECTLHGGVPLEIDLGPAGCAGTPESYDRVHPLVSIDGSTLWVGTCPLNALDCTQCETDVPTPLTFTPLELGTIAMPGDCLHVIAQRANPTNPDACRFQSVVIETTTAGVRRPILVGRNTPGIPIPPVDNTSPLANFNPVLTYVDNCACAEFPEECCDGVSTTVFGLEVGLPNLVHIGEHAVLDFPNETYDFVTLDAFQDGSVCDKPTREAWGLAKKI